jgi:uncharacterized protein YbbC (DUF1343 family)
MMKIPKADVLLILLMFIAQTLRPQERFVTWREIKSSDIQVGAERFSLYLPLLKNKKVAIVANQTSMVSTIHLVDTLLSLKINIVKIFAPEHGFRGEAEAGALILNGKDIKTGLPTISLYGKQKKPTQENLKDVDVILFDIQDVGVRFYTYISTLHYVMEACVENTKELIVLDRPNPNGFYVDGPVLEKEYASFVGMHSVPLVHGMTIGEYAQMINGEKWLNNKRLCKLKVIPVKGYNHTLFYRPPVNPSPNLNSIESIYLYPSLGLFEGTKVSVGRGTYTPFSIIGYPGFSHGDFTFKPVAIKGMSENPFYQDTLCNGINLSEFARNYLKVNKSIYLFWLIGMYESYPAKDKFFTSFFDKLAGTDTLRKQIIAGKTEGDIRKSWKMKIDNFKKIRKKYLLYTDFEN